MKQMALFLIAIAFPAGLLAQTLPETPQPAETSEPPALKNADATSAPNASMWGRLERLPRGEKIKIRIDGRRWERCEFAGATDDFLYCAPPQDSGDAQAWQIGRLNVSNFKLDDDVRNGRIAFASGVVSVGLVLALQNTHNDGKAVAAGMLGAFLGMIPGGVASCVAGHCITPSPDWFHPAPAYSVNVQVPLRGFGRRSR